MASPAERFLLDFHEAFPGVTAQAFGALPVRCRGATFASSYAALTAVVPPAPAPLVVLDLGCGNGHLLGLLAQRRQPGLALAGLDMSGAELRATPPAVRDAATLILGRAQAVPLDSGGVDVVLSHMALMLMDDIDAVLAETARVLRPGGALAFVVGAGAVPLPAFTVFLGVLDRHLQAVAHPMPRLGDRRFRGEAGIRELLARDFDRVEVDDLEIGRRVTPAGAWASFERMYDLHQLDSEARERARREYLDAVQAHVGADGALDLPQRLRLARALRRKH